MKLPAAAGIFSLTGSTAGKGHRFGRTGCGARVTTAPHATGNATKSSPAAARAFGFRKRRRFPARAAARGGESYVPASIPTRPPPRAATNVRTHPTPPTLPPPLLPNAASRRRILTTPMWYDVALVTLLYGIPGIIVTPSFAMPLLLRSVGSLAWALVITVATLFPAPHNYRLLVPATFAVLALVCHRYWNQHATAPEQFSRPLCCLDVATSLFWCAYMFTYFGKPEEGGTRRSPRVLKVMRVFYEACVRYFKMQVICDESTRGALNDPRNQFVFGFHPHGIFPGTALYVAECQVWRDALGANSKTSVTCHIASIVLNAPTLRDFALAVGTRAVTAPSIRQNLREGHSSLLVPGGQADFLLSHYSSTELHLAVHHKGFIRLAIQSGVPLVPVISMGETNVFDNIHWYGFQRLMLKLIGFALLVFPYGRCYVSIPNRTRVTVLTGKPIRAPTWAPTSREEMECLVNTVGEAYYNELIHTFYKHRARAGFPEMELFLHYGIGNEDPTRKGTDAYNKAKTTPSTKFSFPSPPL